jgi:molecular chaperone DnaJ
MSDYYQILGVEKTANADEIKKAYRKLAMQYHPDKNPGDKAAEAKFKEINDAYQVLGDEEKKQKYDSYGHSAYTQSGGGGYSSGFDGAGFDFNDIFSSFFGSSGGRAGRNPFESDDDGHSSASNQGQHLRYNLEITLKEAYDGLKKTISFSSNIKCGDCNGVGGKDVKTCNVCRGHGKTRVQKGMFVIEQTCSVCNGRGVKIQNQCKTCYGSGKTKSKREVEINIPRGIESDTQIRVAEYGEYPGGGGRYGDLYVVVKVRSDDFFTRDGKNLNCKIPIKFTTAILGGEVLIPTISGESVMLKIPEGTQNATKLKISNKGMPSKNSLYGDMIVEIHVETAINLTKDQKDILKKLDEEISSSSTPKYKTFSEKIKSMFK